MSEMLEALRSKGRRARIMDAQMVIKLPARAKELINEAAKSMQVSDSTVVREAIAEFLERRGYRQ